MEAIAGRCWSREILSLRFGCAVWVRPGGQAGVTGGAQIRKPPPLSTKKPAVAAGLPFQVHWIVSGELYDRVFGLDCCEFHSNSFLEMADNAAAHIAQDDHRAKGRPDVDLNRCT